MPHSLSNDELLDLNIVRTIDVVRDTDLRDFYF